MSDLEIFRLLAIAAWAAWVGAFFYVTIQYVRAWRRARTVGERVPFIVGAMVLGLGNIIETSITLAAVFQPEALGRFALYMLLIWPIVRALGFVVVGWSVMRR